MAPKAGVSCWAGKHFPSSAYPNMIITRPSSWHSYQDAFWLSMLYIGYYQNNKEDFLLILEKYAWDSYEKNPSMAIYLYQYILSFR